MNNYNFYKHIKTKGNAYRWSCTSYGARKRCKAHLIIDENLQVLKANIVHNHIIGQIKKKRQRRKGKRPKKALKKSKINIVENSNKETEVSSGTTTESTNIELKQVQNVSPPSALILLDDDNKETEKKELAKKYLEKDKTKITSKQDSDNTKIETEVTSVMTTEVTNIVFKEVQDVNSPEELIISDDDNIETDKKKEKEKRIIIATKSSKRDKNDIISKEDSDNMKAEAEVTRVTTSEVTNIEFNQVQDVNSLEELIISDDDNMEIDEKEGKEKNKIIATNNSKKDKTDLKSKEVSNSTKAEAEMASVTTTMVTDIKYKQVQEFNSADALIVSDDDNIETEKSKGTEKTIKITKHSKNGKTEIKSKGNSDDSKIKTEVPVVTTTDEIDVDLIQVHDDDSPDEPIVLDDD